MSSTKQPFLKRLVRGELGLARTYWLYGLAVWVVAGIASVVLPVEGRIALAVIILPYTLIVVIGIWRAANAYEEQRWWGRLAKASIVLGLVFGIGGQALLMSRFATAAGDQSRMAVAEYQVEGLTGALQIYRLDVGSYPSTSQGLAALLAAPTDVADYWNGPYLMDETLLDPWDTPYQYESPVENLQGFALYSLGADGQPGGEGVNADIGYLPNAPAQ